LGDQITLTAKGSFGFKKQRHSGMMIVNTAVILSLGIVDLWSLVFVRIQ
jgi:hypothetical protein